MSTQTTTATRTATVNLPTGYAADANDRGLLPDEFVGVQVRNSTACDLPEDVLRDLRDDADYQAEHTDYATATLRREARAARERIDKVLARWDAADAEAAERVQAAEIEAAVRAERAAALREAMTHSPEETAWALQRLQREAAKAPAERQAAREKLADRMATDLADALEWCAQDAVQAEVHARLWAEVQRLVADGVAADYLAAAALVAHETQREVLAGAQRQLRSTSAWHNLVKLAEHEARGAWLADLQYLAPSGADLLPVYGRALARAITARDEAARLAR